FAGIDSDMVVDAALVDPHTFYVVDNVGSIRKQDEASLAASQIADYGGANTFANGSTNGTFGVCLQGLTSATVGSGWVVDGGTCTASDTDPWKRVPMTPYTVATAAQGASANATFVWGMHAKTAQTAGTYRAAVAFETLAPAV
ncbi:MAG: hypothetical protein JWM86_1880, partial [Thermoleophilia bacterium]|nr:hypothetical protein [Thermoleophilia bacterium]